jgi:probable rRNA maturation factor
MTTSGLSISTTTKGKLPRLPFDDFKRAVLGKSYDLSLVFIGDALSKKLNATYRDKNTPTNILSFPLGPKAGEIFINRDRCNKEAKKFSMSPEQFTAYLFIHGLLHLKGLRHGSKMEEHERKLLNRFRILS